MAAVEHTLTSAFAGALASTAGESDTVKVAALNVAAASIPPPSSADAGWLWKALVSGLLAVLLLSLAGIVWSVLDGKTSTGSDVLVTIFTATLTALMGLFVKPPAGA